MSGTEYGNYRAHYGSYTNNGNYYGTGVSSVDNGMIPYNVLLGDTGVNTSSDTTSFISQSAAADGSDDGKISTGDKLKNLAKGLVSPVTSMFSSPGNFIKGAATIAVCAGLIFVTAGAAAPVLVAAGAVMGGYQLAKGAYNASNAKTDAEAEEAWQNIGAGTSTLALSVAGAKPALSAARTAGVEVAAAEGEMGVLSSFKSCLSKNTLKSSATKSYEIASTEGKTNLVGAFTKAKQFVTKKSQPSQSLVVKEEVPTYKAGQYDAKTNTFVMEDTSSAAMTQEVKALLAGEKPVAQPEVSSVKTVLEKKYGTEGRLKGRLISYTKRNSDGTLESCTQTDKGIVYHKSGNGDVLQSEGTIGKLTNTRQNADGSSLTTKTHYGTESDYISRERVEIGSNVMDNKVTTQNIKAVDGKTSISSEIIEANGVTETRTYNEDGLFSIGLENEKGQATGFYENGELFKLDILNKMDTF